eukprot:COSAG01_NODE_53752_length_337_cov_0.306723_1_plen_48_part_10
MATDSSDRSACGSGPDDGSDTDPFEWDEELPVAAAAAGRSNVCQSQPS